jgi:DNA-binding PadR family transcriptional regulator
VFDLPEGTVYPALHRLERQHLVKSRWTSGTSGRKRRLYSLTPSGRRQLIRRRGEWIGFARAVASIVEESP